MSSSDPESGAGTSQEPGPVSIELYDARGRLVETLLRGEHREPGEHSLRYRSDLASGIYLLRMSGVEESQAIKISLVR